MSRSSIIAGLLLAAALGHGNSIRAQATAEVSVTTAPVAEASSVTDYSNPAVWLCWPGRSDACTAPLDATIIEQDGTLRREAFLAANKPGIDCFYVYPTVSKQATGNSDLIIGPEENSVVLAQFARFAQRCRLFAPMYRQITLTALRSMLLGKPIAVNRELGYNDVLAAWRYYLDHENHGRGFVLVGHSQGSMLLTKLIAEQIDGKPLQKQMISAILMGTNLSVPKGKDVGGAFQHVPVCHSNTQIGCVIAFSDFRADSPPPANTHFGKVADENMQAVCANPAALGGGSGKLDAYLSSRRLSAAADPTPQATSWTIPEQSIDTPFVKVPGLLSAECVSDEHGSYIAVSVHPSEKGKRVNTITGDVVVNGRVLDDWGLHLIDANLHMGNLIAVVGDEAKAYQPKAAH